LEYGKGIDQDFVRAAKYYRLSAELNNAAAQNSFGICLERGIGLQSNLVLAAHYYQQSALHPEADLNYRRCLRLLGRWEVPNRSSDVSANPLSNHQLASLFIDCLKEPEALNGRTSELFASIDCFQAKQEAMTNFCVRSAEWSEESEVRGEESSIVKLKRSPDGTLEAVKTSGT
jgi:TPR repeat protein